MPNTSDHYGIPSTGKQGTHIPELQRVSPHVLKSLSPQFKVLPPILPKSHSPEPELLQIMSPEIPRPLSPLYQVLPPIGTQSPSPTLEESRKGLSRIEVKADTKKKGRNVAHSSRNPSQECKSKSLSKKLLPL